PHGGRPHRHLRRTHLWAQHRRVRRLGAVGRRPQPPRPAGPRRPPRHARLARTRRLPRRRSRARARPRGRSRARRGVRGARRAGGRARSRPRTRPGARTRARGEIRAVSRASRPKVRTTPNRRPAPEGDTRPSVVVPALDEERVIGSTVTTILDVLGDLEGGVEVVVVDDGSSDATAEVARAAGAHRVIELPQNTGKGAAVRAGALAATGRTVAFTDADLAYAPDQILPLLERVEEGWDLVVGSRYVERSTAEVSASLLRRIGGRVVNLLVRLVLAGDHADTQCGLKAFRRDVA